MFPYRSTIFHGIFRHGSLRILEYSLGQDQSRNIFIYLFFVEGLAYNFTIDANYSQLSKLVRYMYLLYKHRDVNKK